LACLKHTNVLADREQTLPLNDFFHMTLEPRQAVFWQDFARPDIHATKGSAAGTISALA
jgi:hypothetical protein